MSAQRCRTEPAPDAGPYPTEPCRPPMFGPLEEVAEWRGFSCFACSRAGIEPVDAIPASGGGHVPVYGCPECGELYDGWEIRDRLDCWDDFEGWPTVAPEAVPEGVLPAMYRDLLSKGGQPADDQDCPKCGGLVAYCEEGLVPDEVARLVEYQCLECAHSVYEERICVVCGTETRDGPRPEQPLSGEFATCMDCYPDHYEFPDWWPSGGSERCRDCSRGEWDGVDAPKRRTWGIYPQDIRRVEKMPRHCDECWSWRVEMAPKKPTKDERFERAREVNTR